MKNKQIFSESTPPRHKGLFARFFALFFCLVMGMNVWGETIFSFAMTSSTVATDASGYTATGGKAIVSGSAFPTGGSNEITVGTQTYYKFNSSTAITFQLASGTFSAGDVVTFTCASNASSAKTGKGLILCGPDSESPKHTITGDFPKASSNTITYTIVAEDGICGTNSLKVMRADSDIKFGSVVIESACSSCSDTKPSIFGEASGYPSVTLTASGYTAGATLKWYKGSTEIPGETNSTLVVTESGNYKVVATKDCNMTSDVKEVSIVDPASLPDFTFTPGATSGNLATGDVLATTTGGVMKVYSTKNETSLKWDSRGLNFSGGSADQVLVDLNKYLVAGSVITVVMQNTSTGARGLNLLTETGTSVMAMTQDGASEFTKSYPVVAGDGLAGNNEFRLQRNSSTFLKSIEITGLGATVVRYSVTFDMQGATSDPIPSQTIRENKKAVKPATDPTKDGFDFVKWVVAATETDYDFDAAVTADVALKAVWTPQVTKYTVTYAKGDEAVTGDVPTQESLAAGANFTVAEKGTLAWANHVFTGWKDQDETAVAAGAEYTMPAKAVTLTAQWNEVVTYDVTFNLQGHGAAIETQHVNEGEKATEPAAPKAELYTFGGWYTEAECTNAFDFATTTITAAKELFAKWTAFGEATSINIEQFVIDNGKSGDIQAALTAANFDFNLVSGDELDDLVADESKNDKNCAFRGLKLKHDGSFVVGNIPAGKLVDVVLGNLGAAKVQINGADAATALVAGVGTTNKTTPDNYKNSHNYYYSETAAVLKVLSTGTSTTVLKGINFLDPFVVTFANGGEIDPMTFKGTALTLPAATGEGEFQGWFDAATEGNKIGMNGDPYTPAGDITLYAQFSAQSSDNSLKTLKYGETSILEADKYTYDIVLPYKSVIPASVTYEANSLVATPAGEQTATVTDGTATFTITAENGDDAEYTVNFTVAKKDAIEILGTTVTGQKAHGEMTGLFSEGAEADLYVSSSYKLDKDRYVGLTLPEGKKFAAGDIVAIDVKTIQGCVGFTLFTDKGTTLIIDTRDGNAVSTGWNYVTLPEDYVGSQSIYLYRVNNSETNMNPEVNGMKVLRVMNPVLTALTVAGKTATIDEANKTISVKLDNGTDAATAELVPTIVANGGVPTAALADVLAYNTPVNYVVTDKDGDQTTYVLTATEAAAPAAEPVITVQPASHDYEEGAVIAALTVEATVSDAGALSFQWKKDGVAIVGATAATYTPTEAGSYTVVVTNTLGEETAEVESEAAVITITHHYTFEAWVDEVDFTKAGEWTMFTCNSGGKIAQSTTKFAANQTIDEEGTKANAFTQKYFVVKFEKDVKAIEFHAFKNSSTLYNFASLKVAADEAAAKAGTYTVIDVTDKVTRTLSDETRGKHYTFTIEGIRFEEGKYYFFELGNSMPIYDFFYTEQEYETIRTTTPGKIITMCQSKSIEVLKGAVAYDVEKKNAIGIDLVEAEFPLVAGKPYILQAEAENIRVLFGSDETTEVVEANGLVGRLDTQSDVPGGVPVGAYVFQDNHLRRAAVALTFAHDRAYLDYESVQDNSVSSAPGRRRISLGGAEAEVATGMEAIESVEAQKILRDGAIIIIRGGKMYNVNGQLLK